MKIAFFSTWHGRGTTTNSIVTAINLAINYNAKILLTHSQYTRSSMEHAFMIEDKHESDNILNFNDIGIDSIERLVKSRQLKSEDFSDYTLSFIENRLELLVGSKKSNINLFSEDIDRTILDILNKADKHYDFTIIDVNSGYEDVITNKIIRDCDLIVYNVDQNEKIIKDFFRKDINKLDKKKLLILLSRYDENIKCSAGFINNNFKWKDEIYKINYSTRLIDFINNHSIIKFFYACNRKEDKFFKNLNLLSQRIVDSKESNIFKFELQKHSLLNLKDVKKFFKFS